MLWFFSWLMAPLVATIPAAIAAWNRRGFFRFWVFFTALFIGTLVVLQAAPANAAGEPYTNRRSFLGFTEGTIGIGRQR